MRLILNAGDIMYSLTQLRQLGFPLQDQQKCQNVI